jgi:hypothetical protein
MQMNSEQSHKIHLSLEDQQRLQELRAQKPARNTPKPALAPGAILADRVAETVGSWRFIIIQSVLLGIDRSEHAGIHQSLGSLSLHLAELSSFFSSSPRSAHHHDESEPSIRD